MFWIDIDRNEAVTLKKKKFKELKINERYNLQEWISKNPNILGEKLLIIQKEFSGFDETKERLDLLALDTDGNLVIIENKLDDSGKDVVWQSLKYASYCSGLTKSDIIEIHQKYLKSLNSSDLSEDVIMNFLSVEEISEIELNINDQRIILVSGSYRKEVTSTVLWLLEHNINIKCIRVTPYKYKEQIFLNSEQIIPITEAEEYIIKIAKKKQEEITNRDKSIMTRKLRTSFWNLTLKKMNKISTMFQNVNTGTSTWVGCGSGYSGIRYNFIATGTRAAIELFINRNESENKEIFDRLLENKNIIEKKFGNTLKWEKMTGLKSSKIYFDLEDVSIFNESDWNQMIEFLTSNMVKFEKAFKDILKISVSV